MFDFAKVLLAQAEKRRAVKFGVAAHVIIRVWMQLSSVGISPELLRVVAAMRVYFERVPVLFLARHERTALDEQDFFSTRSKVIRQCAAACARTDNDEIVIAVVHTPICRHECRILTRSFCVREFGGESTNLGLGLLCDKKTWIFGH